jgi:hypothetical protein
MSWYKQIKTAAEIEKEVSHFLSKDRREESFYFSTNRKHETSYSAGVVFRQINNKKGIKDPYWLVSVKAYSFESGNTVYKKHMYFYNENKKKAVKVYNEAVRLMKELHDEQEGNDLPTASIPSMIWHALHDLDGDNGLKPKGSGNILYLRQDHNINENKGNLFKNIIYLDNADYSIVEESPYDHYGKKNWF